MAWLPGQRRPPEKPLDPTRPDSLHPPTSCNCADTAFPAAVWKEPSALRAEVLPSLAHQLASLSAGSFPAANKDAAVSPMLPKTKKRNQTTKPLIPNPLPATTPLLQKNRYICHPKVLSCHSPRNPHDFKVTVNCWSQWPIVGHHVSTIRCGESLPPVETLSSFGFQNILLPGSLPTSLAAPSPAPLPVSPRLPHLLYS